MDRTLRITDTQYEKSGSIEKKNAYATYKCWTMLKSKSSAKCVWEWNGPIQFFDGICKRFLNVILNKSEKMWTSAQKYRSMMNRCETYIRRLEKCHRCYVCLQSHSKCGEKNLRTTNIINNKQRSVVRKCMRFDIHTYSHVHSHASEKWKDENQKNTTAVRRFALLEEEYLIVKGLLRRFSFISIKILRLALIEQQI